ncbi:MAG: hypothetical protein M3O70_21905 [Actinomycetota bacterium]|nr:hypothetical protein [Actinomycetota bacterium]
MPDPTSTDRVSRIGQRVAGAAKQVAGTTAGSEQLRQEGELNAEKADAALEARREEARAEQKRAEAEAEAKERELAVERQQLAAEETAEVREEWIEQQRDSQQERVEYDTARREAATALTAQAQQDALTADELDAVRERAEAERQAQQMDARADEARAAADALEQTDREA